MRTFLPQIQHQQGPLQVYCLFKLNLRTHQQSLLWRNPTGECNHHKEHASEIINLSCRVFGLSLGMKCFGHQTFNVFKRMSKPVLEFLVLVTDDQEEGQEQGEEEKTKDVKKKKE